MKTEQEILTLIEATKRLIIDAEERDVVTQVHFFTGMVKAYENILMGDKEISK